MPGNSKSLPRLYVDAPLERGRLALDADQAHYLGRVLRCREGAAVIVFNGRGDERQAVIESLARRHPVLALGDALPPLPESPAGIVLLQALVKSDPMDLIVQKATELGVAAVHAVHTDFGVVRLDAARRDNRLQHWRRIAHSACEQSRRHRPPDIAIFDSLDDAVAALPAGLARVAFDVGADAALGPALLDGNGVCLALGPEGGFTPDESRRLAGQGFTLASLGPRILRAETAAIAACTAVQWLNGDLGGRAPD